MKILMISIPNHHFFQWVDQLKDSGYEIFWFDITDGGKKSNKIYWVKQLKGWRLKWDFPLRSTVKKYLPSLYEFIQKYNENSVLKMFKEAVDSIRPDIVHCFEMRLSGLPILPILEENKIPLIYSSWGSDMYYFEQLGVSKFEMQRFFNRVDYLISDCNRDYQLAIENGFKNQFLGVFPGNGGLTIDASKIKKVSERKTILIKGYEDGIGRVSKVLEALELVPSEILNNKEIVIYSADDIIYKQVEDSKRLSGLPIKIHSRHKFIKNYKLLTLMGESCIHIANSISDGMPNALLEAMAMGAFPIQSNPGKVTEEVITHNKNGLLIANPEDAYEIALRIESAIKNNTLRADAQKYNLSYIKRHYNRNSLKPKIKTLYHNVFYEKL